jgi:site-specific recombinase XerD
MYPELAQFEKWLKCQYSGSSASVHYSSDLALFFSYIKKRPSRITPQDADRYVAHSLKKGHSPSTINRRLSALRTFYYFLSITEDVITACPVLSRHRLRKSYPLPRDVKDSDVETIITQIDSPRDKAMFLLMLDCGLRVSEVHHFSLDNLHFGHPPHVVVHGKGGKQRIVYLSPPAQKALERWLDSRPVSNDRAVFISEHGKRLTVSGIQYLLRGYCKKAGIKLTAHQFRHTFARHMAEAKLPLTSLQALLGHKSVRTTQIYVHLADQHLQGEYDRAIAKSVPPAPFGKASDKVKRVYLPRRRTINWKSYLADYPNGLQT